MSLTCQSTSQGAPGQTGQCVITEHAGEQAFHQLKDEWQELWAASGEAMCEQSWQWQWLFWKHTSPHSTPTLLAARDKDGRCLALTAFRVQRDPKSWIRKATFLGRHYADYYVVLSKASAPEEVGSRLLSHMLSRFRKRVPFVELANIPQQSWTARALAALLPASGCESLVQQWETHTCSIALPATVDEYLARLGSRTRRDYHYDRRRLFREFKVEFRVCDSPKNLDETLDAVERVDRARWGNSSHFTVPSEREFQRALARAFCEMGIFRAFVLYMDGAPRSFVTGNVIRNAFIATIIGHDRDVPDKYSIGNVTNFLAIEECIRRGHTCYDLTRGTENYKKWLGADVHPNLNVRFFRSRIDAALEPMSKSVVSFLRDSSLSRRLRRIIRR